MLAIRKAFTAPRWHENCSIVLYSSHVTVRADSTQWKKARMVPDRVGIYTNHIALTVCDTCDAFRC